MFKKCKFCKTKLTDQQENCPVCKISFNKTTKNLTADERKIWHAARNLHIVAFFILYLVSLPVTLVGLFSLIYSLLKSEGITSSLMGGGLLLVGVFCCALGNAIYNYRRWCYVGGVVFYSIVLIFNLLAVNLIGILFTGLFLYIIANPSAKKILYKKIGK